MSDVTQAFAPVRAKLYVADLGTDINSVTGVSAVPLDFEDLGAISLSAGFSFTPAGAPTRTVEREYYDDAVFFTTESPSDDLPTFELTFNESNVAVIETAFGVSVDPATGEFEYAGGIPPKKCVIFDLADADSSPKTARFLIPRTGVAINGAVTGAGDQKLVKWPITFTAEPSDAIGGKLFRAWFSWLAATS